MSPQQRRRIPSRIGRSSAQRSGEHRRAEAALRASEERFRATFDLAAVGVAHVDLDGRWLRVNQKLCEIVGYAPDELRNLTFQQLTHPDDLATDLDYARQLLHGDIATYTMEKRYFRKNRTAVWANLTGSLVRDASGKPQYFIAIIEDISERKRAEHERELLLAREQAARQQAEDTAERLSRLQEVTAGLAASLTPEQVAQVVLTQGIAALDAVAGMISRCADEAVLQVLHATGYPPELIEAWRRFPLDLSTPAGAAVLSGRAIVLESRTAGMRRFSGVRESGHSRRQGAIVAFPLIVRGKVIGALGLTFAQDRSFSQADIDFMQLLAQQCAQALDRAELYALEQRARLEAQEAVRVRDSFFSIASHELKTPLTVLLGNAQLLQRRAAHAGSLPERDQRVVATIIDQVERLDRMISALLDSTRLDRGQMQIAHEPVDVVALAARIVSDLRPANHSHQIELDVPTAPLLVSGDAMRLEQVLQNLISNAIKYSAHGSRVTVHIQQRDEQVQLAVTDCGIGIPTEAIPNLFRRFYRAENAQRQHIVGMGIGLFVVKEIVSLHGGTINVASVEGEGSTFSVALPLLRASEGVLAPCTLRT